MPRFATDQRHMRQAAFAIRVHSGWGALVTVAGNPAAAQVLKRSRIDIVDRTKPGAVQPYHFAQGQPLAAAERHLAACAASSERLACQELRKAADEIQRGGVEIAGCAILTASGRPLPELSKILASHPLIHTAEGEFFRQAFWRAAERLKIPVTGFRERDLEQRFRTVFGGEADKAEDTVAKLGKLMGPPWTADQKMATLAALLLLTPQPNIARA